MTERERERVRRRKDSSYHEDEILVWIIGIVGILKDKLPDVRLVECAQLVSKSLSLEEPKAGLDHGIRSRAGLFEQEIAIVHLTMIVDLSCEIIFRQISGNVSPKGEHKRQDETFGFFQSALENAQNIECSRFSSNQVVDQCLQKTKGENDFVSSRLCWKGKTGRG